MNELVLSMESRAKKYWHEHQLSYEDGPEPVPWETMAAFALAEREAGMIEAAQMVPRRFTRVRKLILQCARNTE